MTTDVTAAETWQVTKPQTMKTSHMIQKQPGSYWPKTSCDLVAVVTADCELQHVGCSWRRKHSQRPQGMRRVFPDKSNTAVNRCVCSRREEQDEARTVRKVRGRCFHCHCEVKTDSESRNFYTIDEYIFLLTVQTRRLRVRKKRWKKQAALFILRLLRHIKKDYL